MAYQYVAYNESKEIVKGKLEATSEQQANELLGYAGYQVIQLKRLAQSAALDQLRSSLFRVKVPEIILFYHQLALLLDTGMSIATSLEILAEQVSNRALKKVLLEVISDIRGGSQLSAALSKHPEIFPPIQCQSLKVGEQTGNVEEMLRQVSEHMEKEFNAAKGMKSAMVYPVFALVIGVVAVAIMTTFVLPAFSKLFASLGAELPPLTKIVITIGEKFQAYGMYLLLAGVIAGFLVYVYVRTPRGRYNWDKLMLRVPMLGRINHLNELARLSRSISLLFRAGLPLTEILPLVIDSSGNKVMVEALTGVRKDMLGGEGLSRPMARNKLFLPMIVQMVKVGEETGNLDNTLLSAAKSYEVEADDKRKTMVGMIQPIMIIVIGLVVGILALSLLSAMTSVYQLF